MSLVKRLSVAALGLAALSSAANAAISAQWVRVTPSSYPADATNPIPANAETWDLQVNIPDTGDKWTVAGVHILPSSLVSIYNHGFGSNTRPNSALIAAFPALAFDSYVDSFSGGVNVAGPAEGGGSATLDSTNGVNIAWGTNNVAADPAGPTSYPIMRLTFVRQSQTQPVPLAFGQVFSVNGGSNAPVTIPSIPAVPEPTTLALAGLGLGAVAVRRRK